MRFLADESCDFRVIRGLRDAGHDIVAVIEVSPGADDAAVIDMAIRQRRIFRRKTVILDNSCLQQEDRRQALCCSAFLPRRAADCRN
jgi:hypothetical protein